MAKALTFQEMIMHLSHFWAEQGCLIWQPYNVQVGAGTMNPATFLRVLGPEPWRVAYVEPSIRPDDSRYGRNPNRWQQHYQFQVILKPDPGNPQELYMESLRALGINSLEHDIRFVEDDWETPALGAWGLGWEVWLDGQEITQFTYFQQAGGFALDPVSVEITYGLERLLLPLQGVGSFVELEWAEGISYGEVLLESEVEHSRYNLDHADIELLRRQFAIYEEEAANCLQVGLTIPAYDYVLKCSHTFNLLDSRGAIGVTERQGYFARMRELARQVAESYLAERERLGYPLLRRVPAPAKRKEKRPWPEVEGPEDLLFEVGVEELPVADLDGALLQLMDFVPKRLEEVRLEHGQVEVHGTPRRLVVYVRDVAPKQRDEEVIQRGPPRSAAYDQEGKPTQAALGFARGQGVGIEDLEVQEFQGREYVVARKLERGRPSPQILAEALPELLASLQFRSTMRWNESGVAFLRPIRWLVALLGKGIIPFEYAGVSTGRTTRGLRPRGSPEIDIAEAKSYFKIMKDIDIVVDFWERHDTIRDQVEKLAGEVGGEVPEDLELALLREVANLVEWPAMLRGEFHPRYLALPQPVLITVMREHQRYFPVMRDGKLLPYFLAVCNGEREDMEPIRAGNEDVLAARFADAEFFYQTDTRQPLEAFVPKLAGLTFQERLGSVLDKVKRMREALGALALLAGASEEDERIADRAMELCKADLATQMVMEFTSLQGVMGRIYALASGEDPQVAQAIYEHYLPRASGDELPESLPGILVGLADRLATLAGLFALGLIPSGSADPWALRRTALGLVQILVGRELDFSLKEALWATVQDLPFWETEIDTSKGEARLKLTPGAKEHLEELVTFITERLRNWLLEEGFRHDIVEAVLAEEADNPYRAWRAAEEANRWTDSDDFGPLLTAYARTARIVTYAQARDLAPQAENWPLVPEALMEPASQTLYKTYTEARKEVEKAKGVDELFQAMLPLVEPINTFFDEVLVVAQEESLLCQPEEVARRHNLLALLQRIKELTKGFIDLSKVEGY